ncbi:unnamed protein product [Ilex paraguariensis]|uniref:Calmodulin-binding protein n=1 Tax=Ilex paraguariensis TaxID=185542 RepID=A0ABC8R1P9_9AQUA
MQLNRQLEDGNNVGSEENSSSDDELMKIFDIRIKRKLEVMVTRTVERVIAPIAERVIVPIADNLFRRVVNEAIELAPEKILTSINQNPERAINTSEPRILKLQFPNKVGLPVFTGEEIKGEGGNSITIELIDDLTGQVVNSGPEAFSKVEIVPLMGDFDGDERDNWTHEEFNDKIFRENEGRNSLLVGSVDLKLHEGIGRVGAIKFKHGAHWMKIQKFRLGARVVDRVTGTRVKEAKTESFLIKDRRNKRSKKSGLPSLCDDVSQLKHIGERSHLRKCLNEANINTVQDFLTLLNMNPERLQQLLGPGAKKEVTLDHARKCIIDKKVYLYHYPPSQQNTGVVFNVVGQVLGLLLTCQYVPFDKLSKIQKVDAHKSVVSALAHLDNALLFDDETSLLQYSSDRSNASEPSYLPNMDTHRGQNFVAFEMNREYGHTLPSASFQGINSSDAFYPSIYPILQRPSDHISEMSVEYRHTQQSIIPSISPPGGTCSVDDFGVAGQGNMVLIVDTPSEAPGPELDANQHSAATGFIFVGPQPDKALKSWTMLFSVVRCFSKWRNFALDGIHVQKKTRFC